MAGPGKPGRPRKNQELDPDTIELFPSDLPEDIAEVFDALPGEDKVISLFRVLPSGPPSFLVALSPDGLRNLSVIQDEFGGGKYKAVAMNFETKEKIERSFSIEGEPKIRGAKVITKDPKTGFFLHKSEWKKELGYDPERENNSGQDAVLRLYERQIDKMQSEIDALKSQKSNGGMSEALALIIQAKDLIAPQTPMNQSTIDVQTLFNAMTKGMDMVSDRENESSQPPWMGLVRELLPQIQQIVTKVGTPKPPGTQTQPTKPGEPEVIQPVTGFAALGPMLTPYLPTFIDAAAQNDDPDLLVTMVAKRLQGEHKQAAISWLQSDKWFLDLVTLNQSISLQRGWWDEFHDGLLAGLTGQVIEGEESNA